MKKKKWDVIVVGSGPGGSMAAKTCVEAGLSTLILEKKKLPRDKVCTGMLMAPWAQNLVKQKFGAVPATILADPYKGITLHVGERHSVTIPNYTPVGWRKNLDSWMCWKAVEAGANIEEEARVMRIVEQGTYYEVEYTTGGATNTAHCRYIIGADGAISAVRRSIFPNLNTKPRTAVRECYPEILTVDRDYFHWFFPFVSPSPRFDVNYKQGFYLIEGGGIKAIKTEMMNILMEFGMPFHAEPLWRDACSIPVLYKDLFDGSFVPAKRDVLLVGDAGGLLVPFTQEGIGSALKSGLLAAESVIGSIGGKGSAGGIYGKKIGPMIEQLKHFWDAHQGLSEKAKDGAEALCEAMAKLVEETLKEDTGPLN